MTENVQGTPPHQPTYNVRLSEEQIRSIIAQVFPADDLTSCKQLESGKSFNNRIYFIETSSKSTGSQAHSVDSRRSLVLKLSGHYFGARKVQNEVGSLLLVRHFCPSVPVPEVLAWSEDGSAIRTLRGKTFEANQNSQKPTHGDGLNAFSKHGWILTTRMPGRVLNDADLSGPHGTSVIKEIARCLASWRNSIPSPSSIGCIRFPDPSEQPHPNSTFNIPTDVDPNEASTSPSVTLTVGGLILCHRYDPAPLSTPLSCYTYIMEDQLFRLRGSSGLRSLCARIEPKIEALVRNLSQLSSFRSPPQPQHYDTAKLTHFDFAPRNILILEDETGTPHVTGILDFEFSGFFPHVDEFLNMKVRQPDDWSTEQYDLLTKELVHLGCDVPHSLGQQSGPVCTKASTGSCVCEARGFEGFSILARLIENIAPWWIQEGSHSEEQLQIEVDKAAEKVELALDKLKEFML